eukprot:9185349-Pyramimonas_sp.AAC.1
MGARGAAAEVPLSLPLLKMVVGKLQKKTSLAMRSLLGAFRLRVRNHASEFLGDAWGQHVVQLIRK